MTKMIIRFIGFLLLFITLFAGVSIMLTDDPKRVLTLLERTYWQLPYGAWLVIIFAALSFYIAAWSVALTRQRDLIYKQSLDQLLKDSASLPKLRAMPKKQRQQFVELAELIQTQKKSLQRLINDDAKAKEALIEEQVIQERQRLARELHDSVSQQLFAASMMLSAINETADVNGITAKQLAQTEKIVQQAQLEMRALLLHLRPAALKGKTLAEGLQDLLTELRQKVLFTIHERIEEVQLQKGTEDHLFRIAQETLSNTLRHSKATEVDLLLVERDRRVILRVQDNGVGFETTDETHSGSYGLRNIEERAIEIGGTCKIVSLPNQGTMIEVQIPIEQEEQK
jgi:signal transduction histidine kinase